MTDSKQDWLKALKKEAEANETLRLTQFEILRLVRVAEAARLVSYDVNRAWELYGKCSVCAGLKQHTPGCSLAELDLALEGGK